MPITPTISQAALPASVAGRPPEAEQRRDPLAVAVLGALSGAGALNEAQIAARLDAPVSVVRGALARLVGRGLVAQSGKASAARYATAWVPSKNPRLTEEALRLASGLGPVDPEDQLLAECPRCSPRRMAVALGRKREGGQCRLVYRCGNCGCQFYASSA